MTNVLIVGIDPGTTGFKTAHTTATELDNGHDKATLRSNTDNEHITVHTGYPGNLYDESTEVATTLIYSPNGQLLKWGHVAANHLDSDQLDHDYVVNHWKLGLHQASEPAGLRLQRNLQAAAQRIWQGTKYPNNFAQDFFSSLGHYLFNDETSVLLQDQGGTLDNFKYVDIVIAVPPGWARQEHRIFSQAARLGIGQRPGWRIFTVSETECVLRAWLKQPGIKGKALLGDLVMLLDLGGGTACLSVFMYENESEDQGRWAHIESHSLSAGSELVTEEFIEDFKTRLESAGIQITSQLLFRARDAFNRKKRSVGDKDEADMFFNVRGLQRDDSKDFLEDKMVVPRDKARTYFQPSQDLLLKKIDEVATRIVKDHGALKFCVVAGAYAKNMLFRERLKDLNHKFGMQVFYPQNGQELVVKGACFARLQGDFREHGGSRLSIGILTYERWSEIKKICLEAHKRKFKGDTKWWSPLISWAIKKGGTINRNRPISLDGKIYRKRYFEHDEEIEFTEPIFISEAYPGTSKVTVLKHSTGTPATMMENYKNLNERKIPVDAISITWKLNDTRLKNADGSWGSLDRAALLKDLKDKRRYLEYRYFFEVTQTDCRVAIEAKFAHNKCERRYVSLLGMGDCESAALQEEYNNYRPNALDISTRAPQRTGEKSVAIHNILSEGHKSPVATKRKATHTVHRSPVLGPVEGKSNISSKRHQPSLKKSTTSQRSPSEEYREEDSPEDSEEDVIPPRRRTRQKNPEKKNEKDESEEDLVPPKKGVSNQSVY